MVYFSDDSDVKLNAVFVYALATFSDFLDGYLARKLGASSNLGKVLDPLGDKLLTFAVMICITVERIIPLWAVLVFFIKEILMAIGGFVVHRVARVEIPPSNLIGKISTVVFFVACVTLMLFRNIPNDAAAAIISGAIALMIVALASYVNTYATVMKNRDKSS